MKSKPLYHIPIGTELTLDNHTWSVVAKDLNGYIVEGADCDQTLLTFERVESAIKSGTCEIVTRSEKEDRRRLLDFTGGFARLDQLPEAEQRNARARQGLMLAMEQMEAEGQKLTHRYLDQLIVRKSLYSRALEISGNQRLFEGVEIGPTRASATEPATIVPKGRTLANCLRDYVSFNRNPVVLINRHNKKGSHDPEKACKLTEWQIKFVKYVMAHFAKPQKPNLAKIYRDATDFFEMPELEGLRGVKYPSITTVRNWIANFSHVAMEIGRNGLRHSKNKHAGGATDIRALMYGERAATDQAYLSIFVDAKGEVKAREIDPGKVSKELGPEEVMRVWLHFMMDVATRLPLAWILSESPHSDQTQALLRMATRDKTKEKVRYGCKQDPAPAAALLLTTADNGVATRNGKTYSSQIGMGMMVQTGRTYHSNDNSFAERPFGRLQWDVLNFEGGYVGSGPGEMPGYDPKAATRLTPNDLQGVLTRYYVDEYSHMEHRGIGMFGATPAEKLEQVKAQYGEIKAPSPEERRIHLGIKKTVTTHSEGIHFMGIPFNSSALLSFHDGKPKKVNVYLDPDFPHEVTVSPLGSTKIMKADNTLTAMKDLTLEEILAVMKAAATANPEKREINNAMLSKARAARAKLSGFYTDPNLPESYLRLAELEKQAEGLTQIGYVPDRSFTNTVMPGSITKRPTKKIVTRRTDSVPVADENASKTDAKYPKIKEQKF
jgi:putative transposase